jgi:hypothetical protein
MNCFYQILIFVSSIWISDPGNPCDGTIKLFNHVDTLEILLPDTCAMNYVIDQQILPNLGMLNFENNSCIVGYKTDTICE